MPLDATNMPHAPLGVGSVAAQVAEAAKLDPSLRLEGLLLEEFNYASSTAYQAMEDRARLFNTYVWLLFIMFSGLTAIYTHIDSRSGLIQLMLVFVLIGGVVGVAFFVKIIRLRQAWRESLVAMNDIKEYYINLFRKDIPNLDQVFHWRKATLPKGEKVGSVTFIVCGTIAFLSSLCFGAVTLIGLDLYTNGQVAISQLASVSTNFLIGLGAFVVVMAGMMLFYRRALHAR